MNRSVYAIITLTGNVTLMFTYLHFSMQKDIGLLALGAWLLKTAIFNFIASRQRLLHTGRLRLADGFISNPRNQYRLHFISFICPRSVSSNNETITITN